MEAIRTKDKIFLAVAIPLAAAAAYVFLWRTDAAKRVSALAGECASLVAAEDFPIERTRAERSLVEAKAALEAERKIPMPAAKVEADAAESAAARELALQEAFRRAGIAVVNSAGGEPKDASAGDVLRRTGTRPEPVCRVYELEGSYPALVAALRDVAQRRMAVVPTRVEMPRPGRWRVEAWL